MAALPDTSLSSLHGKHQELKRAMEELRADHHRLCPRHATSAECDAHRKRLRNKRLELEQHYLLLRQLAQRRYTARQEAFAKDVEAHPATDSSPAVLHFL
jgi:hypothetical protein